MVVGCPDGVNRDRAVRYAHRALGEGYDWLDDVDLGVDCLLHTRLHDDRRDVTICSELVARAWQAGGWACPKNPALVYPADLASYAWHGWL